MMRLTDCDLYIFTESIDVVHTMYMYRCMLHVPMASLYNILVIKIDWSTDIWMESQPRWRKKKFDGLEGLPGWLYIRCNHTIAFITHK